MTEYADVSEIDAARNRAALDWWNETLLPRFLAAVERSRWPIGPIGTMEADIRGGTMPGQCIARQSFVAQRFTAALQGAVELLAAKGGDSPKVVLRIRCDDGEHVGREEPFYSFPLQALDQLVDNAFTLRS